MQTHIILSPGTFHSSTISQTVSSLQVPGTDVVGVIITIDSADIRMRADGTDPVGGNGGGLKMTSGSVWEIEGREWIVNAKFIRDSTSDAVINVHEIVGE